MDSFYGASKVGFLESEKKHFFCLLNITYYKLMISTFAYISKIKEKINEQKMYIHIRVGILDKIVLDADRFTILVFRNENDSNK